MTGNIPGTAERVGKFLVAGPASGSLVDWGVDELGTAFCQRPEIFSGSCTVGTPFASRRTCLGNILGLIKGAELGPNGTTGRLRETPTVLVSVPLGPMLCASDSEDRTGDNGVLRHLGAS